MTTPNKKEEDDVEHVTATLIEDGVVKKFCSQCCDSLNTGLSLVQPYNQVLPASYLKHHRRRIQNFDVFEDDVWLCAFPKSGKHYF